MPRQLNRLTAAKVNSLKVPGLYGDGGNLWLQVSPSGSKSWVFRFMLAGKSREMGLGSLLAITLQEARRIATDCRAQLAAGVDPIERRSATQTAALLSAARSITFKDCAEKYVTAHEAGWRNAKHVAQWRSTLKEYVYPVIGDLPVGEVDTALVTKVLEPIWQTKPETASRVRGRIEAILDWATARQFRKGDNPARWKGNLKYLLPRAGKLIERHHAALAYTEIGAFMSQLAKQPGTGARALEFTVLTASRTSEALLAEWAEFDLQLAIWTIPAARMKAGKEHRVPLSTSAVALLEALRNEHEGAYVFPGGKPNRPLSNMAMLSVLKRMKRGDLTVHGFRSTFRDWAAEATNHSHEIAEMALAHTIGNKVEAAYRRGDLFQKRAKLMQDWADYCATENAPAAQIIPFRNCA